MIEALSGNNGGAIASWSADSSSMSSSVISNPLEDQPLRFATKTQPEGSNNDCGEPSKAQIYRQRFGDKIQGIRYATILPPGMYTANIAGRNDPGVGLVEYTTAGVAARSDEKQKPI